MLVVVLTLYLPFHVREGRGALVFQLDMMMVVEREALREVSGQPALGVKPGYSGGARLLPSCIGRMSELASVVMMAAESCPYSPANANGRSSPRWTHTGDLPSGADRPS